MEKLTHWRGRPIEDLTREELTEVINLMAPYFFEHLLPSAIAARVKAKVEAFKANVFQEAIY